MCFRNCLVGLFAALLIGVGTAESATITVHDAGYTALVSQTRERVYPLAVDADRNLYYVTGTSVADNFVRMAPDGTETTLNSGVGFVVGVFADLEIGFGGNLFANVGYSGMYVDGVIQLNPSTGTSSLFWQSTADEAFADGGLAFDATRQVLYSQSYLPNPDRGGAGTYSDLVALDSYGNATTVIHNLGPSLGLDMESSGTLVTISHNQIRRIDPDTKSVTTILDVAAISSDYMFGNVAVHPDTGDIYFHAGVNHRGNVYRVGADGSDLTLVASDPGSSTDPGGPIGLTIGPSRDGSDLTSIYLGYPNADRQFVELRPVAAPVPEPTSLAMWAGLGIMGLVVMRRRRRSN